MELEQARTHCPFCGDESFGAAGRGLCRECNITFPLPRKSRKELLSVFLQRYYTSKQSLFYHRAGCKYLKNINPENLIELTEPVGKPCRCVR